MSEAALAISFFDASRGIAGIARSGFTLLFEGRNATPIEGGPEIERRGGSWHAVLADRLELELAPVAERFDLHAAQATLCTVTGTVAGTQIEGLGIVGATDEPPRWDELDALRNVQGLFDGENAVVALARRPRGAPGHGDELVTCQLLADGQMLGVEDARLSTVYDPEGRPRTATLELWLPGEDFPRRAYGSVTAGASLALEGLDVHAAVFSWKSDGREGIGLYELTVRVQEPGAA